MDHYRREDKTNWDQDKRIDALEKGQREILEILRPIADTYKSASTMSKWVMAFAVFISIMLGIILSFRSFFGK